MGEKAINGDNLIGMTFGKLKVLEHVGVDKYRSNLWKCECSCKDKTIRIISTHALRRTTSPTRSCGCKKYDLRKDKVIDLTGRVFGRLTVISLELKRNKSKKYMWLCECSCKNKTRKIIKGNSLTGGNTKSCGCIRTEMKSIKHKDWTDKKIGKLTVIKEVGRNKRNDRLWLCRCSCKDKREVIKSSGALSTRKPKSCGCTTGTAIRKSWASKIESLVGREYGKLTVIKMMSERKGGQIQWLCVCSCSKNKKVTVLGRRLKNGSVASCGCMRESLVSNILKEYYKNKNKAILEYREARNPKTNYPLPYDIYIPEHRLYIEIQGIQHYKHIKYFNRTKEGFEYQKYKDRIKKKHAKKNGIFLEIDLRKNMTPDKWILFINKKIMEIEHNEK